MFKNLVLSFYLKVKTAYKIILGAAKYLSSKKCQKLLPEMSVYYFHIQAL